MGTRFWRRDKIAPGFLMKMFVGPLLDIKWSLSENRRLRKYKRALSRRRFRDSQASLYLFSEEREHVGLSEADCEWSLKHYADALLAHARKLIRKRNKRNSWGYVYSSWSLMWEYLRYGYGGYPTREFLDEFWPMVTEWLHSTDDWRGVCRMFGGELLYHYEVIGRGAPCFRPTHALVAALEACLARWDSFDLPEDPADDELPGSHYSKAKGEKDLCKREVIKGCELLKQCAQ